MILTSLCYTCRFEPAVGPPAAITKIIKSKLEGAWKSWKDVDDNVKKMWYEQFEVMYFKH